MHSFVIVECKKMDEKKSTGIYFTGKIKLFIFEIGDLSKNQSDFD